MARNYSTTSLGGGFSQQTIDAVWNKGFTDLQYNSNIYRKDAYGTWMKKDEYGDVSAKYGWEIDHIKPISKGGGDELSNLQPLYWKTNRDKSDTYPYRP
jgi:5-methylcytosine-specific restriction endonuclease McrA